MVGPGFATAPGPGVPVDPTFAARAVGGDAAFASATAVRGAAGTAAAFGGAVGGAGLACTASRVVGGVAAFASATTQAVRGAAGTATAVGAVVGGAGLACTTASGAAGFASTTASFACGAALVWVSGGQAMDKALFGTFAGGGIDFGRGVCKIFSGVSSKGFPTALSPAASCAPQLSLPCICSCKLRSSAASCSFVSWPGGPKAKMAWCRADAEVSFFALLAFKRSWTRVEGVGAGFSATAGTAWPRPWFSQFPGSGLSS